MAPNENKQQQIIYHVILKLVPKLIYWDIKHDKVGHRFFFVIVQYTPLSIYCAFLSPSFAGLCGGLNVSLTKIKISGSCECKPHTTTNLYNCGNHSLCPVIAVVRLSLSCWPASSNKSDT